MFFELASSPIILAVAGLSAAAVVASRAGGKHDPREPPVEEAFPPVVGHLWGLVRYGSSYLASVLAASRYPIITVPVPGSKLYLTKSPEIAAMVHRKAATLTFAHVVELQVGPTCGISEELWRRLNPDDYQAKAVSMGIHRAHHAEMRPDRIVEMHERAFEIIEGSLNGITGEKVVHVQLKDWLREILTRGAASAMYGRENPIKWDESLIEELKHFEEDEGLLFLGNPFGFPLQRLIAYKGWHAVQRFREAFTRYYDSNNIRNASAIIQGRYAIASKQWENRYVASLDILLVQAALMNYMAMMVWLVLHVFADADLLADIRAELQTAMGFTPGEQKGERSEGNAIDAAKIPESCPLLYSIWLECLRYYTVSPSPRYVTEDTVLDNGILLKKDCIVQVLGGVIHESDEHWPDAKTFDPKRFAKAGVTKQKSKNRAFVPFGGGIAWCPGRHFVTAQAMGFIAAIILGFEVTGLGGERVVVPETTRPNMMDSVRPPVREPEVEIRRRPGWENWKVEIVAGVGSGNGESVAWGI